MDRKIDLIEDRISWYMYKTGEEDSPKTYFIVE